MKTLLNLKTEFKRRLKQKIKFKMEEKAQSPLKGNHWKASTAELINQKTEYQDSQDKVEELEYSIQK